MADILTLSQARSALGWKDNQFHDRDDELEEIYIPATTEVVEDVMRRRWVDYAESWVTSAASPITTPWATVGNLTVKSGTTTLTGWTFTSGVLTVTDPAYAAGAELTLTAKGLPVPTLVVLAARMILAQLWNADKQGVAAAGSMRSEPTSGTPAGFAVPRRAEELLAPYSIVTAFA